jgi:hypothetical protein
MEDTGVFTSRQNRKDYVMAKFVKVSKEPEKMEKDCFFIDGPNFIEEIRSCSKKKPKTNLMTPHYIREILGTIGLKYADPSFSALTDINVAKFRGQPFTDESSVQDIVMSVIKAQAPGLIDQYVDHHIKNRPVGTKLIYFAGNHGETTAFFQNGIDEIKEKDVDVYLGLKKKKTVGKPAITKEQAAVNDA